MHSLTAKDANAEDLGLVVRRERRRSVDPGVIPTSSEQPGTGSGQRRGRRVQRVERTVDLS